MHFSLSELCSSRIVLWSDASLVLPSMHNFAVMQTQFWQTEASLASLLSFARVTPCCHDQSIAA